MLIREETRADHDAIHQVTESAFGQPNEARLIERLRQDGLIVASLGMALELVEGALRDLEGDVAYPRAFEEVE